MTEKRDIYETQQRKTPEDLMAINDAAAARTATEKFWATETRRRRLSNLLICGLSALVLGLVAYVILDNRGLFERDEDDAEGVTAFSESPGRPRFLELESRAEVGLVLDERGDYSAHQPQPEEDRVTFNAPWLKQAAFHLVKAEQAYREERWERALEHYTRALEIFPEIRGVHRYRALALLKLNRFEPAASAFALAAEEDPADPGLLNNMGIARLKAGDMEAAAKAFREAVGLDPRYAKAILNLAHLNLQQQQQERAAQHFRQYLNLRPEDIQATQRYALLLLEHEQWEEAAMQLERIRRYAPGLPAVYFRLAQALARSNRPDESIVALRHGSRLADPRQTLGWISRSDFDALRQEPAFQQLLQELSADE